MGKPIVNEFGQEKGILKFFPYEAMAVVIEDDFAGATNKIVKAGTPYPANDATCVGYVLHTVDLTQGDAPATIVYQGSLDNAKLQENGITVSTQAKSATPRVSFFD